MEQNKLYLQLDRFPTKFGFISPVDLALVRGSRRLMLGLGRSFLFWRIGDGCHLEAAKWEIGDRLQNYDELSDAAIHHDRAGFANAFNAVAFAGLVEAFVRWDCCDDVLLELVDTRAKETGSPFASSIDLI